LNCMDAEESFMGFDHLNSVHSLRLLTK
jgi:hypothetical protein